VDHNDYCPRNPSASVRLSIQRLAMLSLLATACSSEDGPAGPGHATASRAFGIWQPGSYETCTKEQHDA
jgi:hypothetical protein